DEAIRLKAKMEEDFGGPKKAGRVWVTGSKVVGQRLDTTFKDLQLVQLRGFERDTIMQVFGIPPEIVGILENSNRATIDAAFDLFARLVVVPRLQDFCDEMQAQLVEPDFDGELRLGFVNPAPQDKDFTLKAMGQHGKAYRVNEVRALTGHEPLDGEDGEETLEGAAAPAPELPPGKGGDPEWTRGPRRSLRPASQGSPPR
ncbi:MAG: phage portal protein, partial [Myxococcales bacterium]